MHIESDLKFFEGIAREKIPLAGALPREGYRSIGDKERMERAAGEFPASTPIGAEFIYFQAGRIGPGPIPSLCPTLIQR